MQQLNLKPAHKLVKNYYEALGQFGQLNIDHEMAVRSAFQSLLAGCGRQFDWTLVPEWKIQRPKSGLISVDGALIDTFRLARGYWEAKDEHDDLEKEIRAKLDKGYPRTNIIFQAPERAVLIQNGVRQGLNEDIRDSANLVELLKEFFGYREPHYEEWDEAVADFKDYIPEIAGAVAAKIEEQRRTNPAFVQRFDAFYELCRQSINPNLSIQAVEEMLVQHLLTERIFRKIFANPEFTRRNVIAVEIEEVIDSMTAKQFSRDAFLKDLDRFYRAIESAAENTETYKQKQDFINTVYERFFQGYSPKEADTHGIVYTPQPIVDFMVRSVEDILQKEFGRSLSDHGVHILDPFVGTGNFITRVMQEIKTSALPYKYENELHCNEVMLLPYYVASMNIEHEYMERTGEYEAFPGICLVDTFELAEPEQSKLSFMSEENTARVKRQKQSPIFVVIGNPPYNVGQVNENDNNKNRKYKTIDGRVSKTYATESSATLLSSLNDPYVKAFRWATDRIEDQGVVAFVSNNSFIDQLSFDGMRRCLEADFDVIYVLNLGGNVRKNPTLSGTTHNVFGIQVGVSVTVLIRRAGPAARQADIYYYSVPIDWRKEQKYGFLEEHADIRSVAHTRIRPVDGTWLTEGMSDVFNRFISLGNRSTTEIQLFAKFSTGVNTSRDSVVYSYDVIDLGSRVREFIDAYNSEVDRWIRAGRPKKIDEFVNYDRLKWSRNLKRHLANGDHRTFDPAGIRCSLYRPFDKRNLFFGDIAVDELGRLANFFPDLSSESENCAICVTSSGSEKPFVAMACNKVPNYHLTGAGSGTQCFPFYTYDEDGSNRRENITDWALNEFRTHYHDPNLTKWDIFHYIYAVLHHPEYRGRYAANLKRELPRIPFVAANESAERGTIVAQDPSTPLRAGSSPGSAVPNESRVPSGTAPTADPSTPPEAGSARDDDRMGRAGLQASVHAVPQNPSTLPKASAEPTAERHKEKAGPSTRAEALGRDDKFLGDAGRGAEAPLYPNADSVGNNRGPSTRAEALAQDDTQVFWRFVEAGRRLAELHVNYEQQTEYPLERVEKGQLNWRVERMRLSKDKTSLVYNDFLTLKGIPPETYEYRLGNRSALEWVIDQYQVSTDKRSGIVNDPNRADDPEYIVRLIGQVITVSLETMKIVKALPPLAIQ